MDREIVWICLLSARDISRLVLHTPRAGTVKQSLLIVKLMSNKLMTKLSRQILNKNKSAYVPDEYFSPRKNSLACGRMV